MAQDTSLSQIAVAFVGCLVPDEAEFQTTAFSRAGWLFQYNFLKSLLHAGVNISLILSARPVSSFPRGPLVWFKSRVAHVDGLGHIYLLSFFNLTPLKQVVLGLCVVVQLVKWRWRMGGARCLVVYTYNLSVPPAACLLFGCWLIGAKCLASINDIDVPGHTVPKSLLFRIDFYVQKWCIRHLDGFSVVADAIAEDFGRDVPWLRMEGGVDQRIIDYSRAAARGVGDPSTFTIVSAGSLDIANGIRVILRAFGSCSDRTYRLVIAGAGPLEGEVRAAAGQDSRIEFRGYVPFRDVLSLYGTADIVLNMRLTNALNTRYFFPSKLTEALACGAPVVTTCTGHVLEELVDLAFLLKDETAAGLASLIHHVESLGPDVREATGRRARAYMLEEKTWDRQGARLVEFLRSRIVKGKHV